MNGQCEVNEVWTLNSWWLSTKIDEDGAETGCEHFESSNRKII
jgi:hypothetical protein